MELPPRPKLTPQQKKTERRIVTQIQLNNLEKLLDSKWHRQEVIDVDGKRMDRLIIKFEPDRFELYSFMVKYSNDKKLFLSDNHIFYILERVERSFENIIKIIDKLDAYTLEIKERVNYKIIRTILES